MVLEFVWPIVPVSTPIGEIASGSSSGLSWLIVAKLLRQRMGAFQKRDAKGKEQR
jgi:hypothetical protein